MALILNIDTATDYASLALSKDGKLLELMKNPELRDHASWVHQAMHDLLIKCGYSLQELDAIAVTAGPGSYTGLRIGMATAKGLCYVLGIPLIAISTLKVMAASGQLAIGNRQLAKDNGQSTKNPKLETKNAGPLLVPMIDARRMEVYTAAYDLELNEIMAPTALILSSDSFSQLNNEYRLICFGSGSKKFEALAVPGDIQFAEIHSDAGSLVSLSHYHFLKGRFADLAYAEPFYLKEFFSTGKK